jgi:ferredoxin
MRGRSTSRIVYSEVTVKSWLERVPTCDEARPARCVCCGAPGRPLKGRMIIVGHGLRGRAQSGPLDPDGAPTTVELRVRRYLCRRCRACLIVAPRGVVRHRRYSGLAIALALALWSLDGKSAREVRRRVSPRECTGFDTVISWPALRRWAQAVATGRLFPVVRRSPPAWTPRRVAERAAGTLAALAPSGQAGSDAARAFFGAAHAA